MFCGPEMNKGWLEVLPVFSGDVGHYVLVEELQDQRDAVGKHQMLRHVFKLQEKTCVNILFYLQLFHYNYEAQNGVTSQKYPHYYGASWQKVSRTSTAGLTNASNHILYNKIIMSNGLCELDEG